MTQNQTLRIPVVLRSSSSFSVRQNHPRQRGERSDPRQVAEGHQPSAGAISRGAERPILKIKLSLKMAKTGLIEQDFK
jgi:hypothetical protein